MLTKTRNSRTVALILAGLVVSAIPLHGQARGRRPALAWEVSNQPFFRIGDVDTDTVFQFARVIGGVRLADGRVVVLEGVETRWFASDGRYLYTTTRRGGGPGELRSATAILKLPGDTVLVESGRPVRHILFSPDGKLVREEAIDHRRLNALGAWVECARLLLPDRSRLLCEDLPNARPLPVDPGPGPFRRFSRLVRIPWSLDGRFSLGIDGGVEQYGIDMGDSQTTFVIHPFHSRTWTAAGGTPLRIAIATNPEYAIEIWRPDGVLERTLTRASVRRPPTWRERAEARKQLASFAPGDATRLKRLLDAVPTPSLLPAVVGLAFTPTGELLVQREGNLPSQPASLFDVFDAGGRYLGELRLPPHFRVLEAGSDYILGLRRGTDDVPIIEAYRLRRSR